MVLEDDMKSNRIACAATTRFYHVFCYLIVSRQSLLECDVLPKFHP